MNAVENEISDGSNFVKKQITTQKSKILITTADYEKCTKDIVKSIKSKELVDKSDID